MYPVDTIKTRMQALYHHPGHAGASVSGRDRGREGAGPHPVSQCAVAATRPRGTHRHGSSLCSAPCRCDAGTARTLSQRPCPPYCVQLPGSVRQAIRSTIRAEGIGGLYRGVGAVAAGAG